jgi:hypothetical protein
VALLQRGGGTSQSGQTIGRALVLDFSKYLNKLIATDAAAGTCVVEPGMVLDELNRQLKPTGLWFPVDVSTASRATIGGMAGNNSCGTRSIRYGIMRDNVLAIDAILADGTGRASPGDALPLAATPTGSSPSWEGWGEGDNPGQPSGRPTPNPSHQGEGQVAQVAGRRQSRAIRHLALDRREAGISPMLPQVSGEWRLSDRRWCRDRGPSTLPRCCAVRKARSPFRAAWVKLAHPQKQGAGHLPLRQLPQSHGGDAAHRQAGPRRR